MNAPAKKQSIVPFWRVQLGEAESVKAREAIFAGTISQGPVTAEFERKAAAILGVPYAVATTSGSMALYLAAAALDIGPGDEVIVPNRTFIATAHAVLLRGAAVRLVDCKADSTLIDPDKLAEAVTPRTKAIMAVHLNGNAADLAAIHKIARAHGLRVIEDAAQAFYSRDGKSFLGTQSDAGCFSFGPTKFITTGQGGLVVTRDEEIYRRMLRFRNHGVDNVFSGDFQALGFNLKFNDILAAVGLAQLEKLEAKKAAHHKFYAEYKTFLAGIRYMRLLPVDGGRGHVPLWVEVLCAEREKVIELLQARGIQARPFVPDLDLSAHLGPQKGPFAHSRLFSNHGLWLPCGPDLPADGYARAFEAVRALDSQIDPSAVIVQERTGHAARREL